MITDTTNRLIRFNQGLHPQQNLFVLGKVSRVAHQFTVYFFDKVYSIENFSVSDNGTITLAQTGSECIFHEKPFKGPFPPIPEKVKTLAERVETLVKKNQPNLSNLKIHYRGYSQLIEVSELILQSPNPDPKQAVLYYSNIDMIYDTENRSFEMIDGMPMPTSVDYVYSCLEKDKEGMPVVIPFYLLGEKVGNSLLRNTSLGDKEDMHSLQEVVLRTLGEIEHQRYQNDWYELEKKPKEILPKGYQQRVYFEIQFYGRGRSNRVIVQEQTKFEFKTQEAYRQDVLKAIEIASLKLTGTVRLSLKEKTLDIHLQRNQDVFENHCKIEGKLLIDEKNGNVALDGEWTILHSVKKNHTFYVDEEEKTGITAIDVCEQEYIVDINY